MSGKDISFDLSSDYGQSNFSVAWICIYFAGEIYKYFGKFYSLYPCTLNIE